MSEELDTMLDRVELLLDADAKIERLRVENARLRDFLTAISSPTQTDNLLWWQRAARDALDTP